MAIGSPSHDQPWSPADALPEATPAAATRPDAGPDAAAEGALHLDLVRAVIEGGLLMVFGPDGDPIPPEIFRVAAAEQPHAGREVALRETRRERAASHLRPRAAGFGITRAARGEIGTIGMTSTRSRERG